MPQPCQDSYTIQFRNFADMLTYHSKLASDSRWERTEVNSLYVEPLDENSRYFGDTSAFAPGVSDDAVKDTAKNLGLAITLPGERFPVRDTAYKSLTDRAKIGGTSLLKLRREVLADTLNECLALQKAAKALVLIRDQKISAVHSGDEKDYAVLPISELLSCMKNKLDDRFTGNEFEEGYSDHSLTSAAWSLPLQSRELLDTYRNTLAAQGKAGLAAKLTPGIRFTTSDTGVASAKVAALLAGLRYPVFIGGMVATEHERNTTVETFNDSLDMLFARFEDSVARLSQLTEVYLDYPVNAMTAVCKRLSMPKKAALEAVAMFEMAYGGGTATAHDLFMAMQEIMFILKAEGTPESKMLRIQESMARALTLKWENFDYAKAVGW